MFLELRQVFDPWDFHGCISSTLLQVGRAAHIEVDDVITNQNRYIFYLSRCEWIGAVHLLGNCLARKFSEILPCGVTDCEHEGSDGLSWQSQFELPMLVVYKCHHAWGFGWHHNLMGAWVAKSSFGGCILEKVVEVLGDTNEADPFYPDLTLISDWAALATR